MKSFEEQLKKLTKQLRKNSQPSSRWLTASRNEMLDTIKASSRGSVEHFSVPVKRSWFARHVRVVSAALVLALLFGSGTTLVAQGAEPGDALYPVKIAAEDITIMVAVSPEAKARLHMKYADRRMQEFEKLYEKEPNKDWEEKVARHINKHMNKTSDHLMTLESVEDHTTLSLMFEEMARMHAQRMEEVRKRIATSSAVILDQQRKMHDKHYDHALDSLERAHKRFEEMDARHEEVERRINERLEMLRERHEELNDRLKDRFNHLPVPPQIILDETGFPETISLEVEGLFEGESESLEEGEHREYHFDDGETSVDVEVYVESSGDEGGDSASPPQVDVKYDDETGTTHTIIRATSDSGDLRMHSTHSVRSSSDRRLIINGEEIEIE